MKRFQYKELSDKDFRYSEGENRGQVMLPEDADKVIAKLGLLGWELVTVITTSYDRIYYYKREISENIL